MFLFGCGGFEAIEPSTSGNIPAPVGPTLPSPVNYCGGTPYSANLMTIGSIHGQDGWFSDPSASFDQSVMSSANSCKGNGVWFLNSDVGSSAFGNQPQSPEFALTAGESTVSNGGGDTFEASFFIRTVSTSADNSGFTLSFSPGPVRLSNDPLQSGTDRHNWLRFENSPDASGGFRIYALDGNLIAYKGVVNQLQRANWLHVRIVNYNADGPSNDVVMVYVNDLLVSTHSTWEDWRSSLPATTLAVNHVLFRISAAIPGSQGFLIDEFEQKTYNYSKPSVIIQQYKTSFEQ